MKHYSQMSPEMRERLVQKYRAKKSARPEKGNTDTIQQQNRLVANKVISSLREGPTIFEAALAGVKVVTNILTLQSAEANLFPETLLETFTKKCQI